MYKTNRKTLPKIQYSSASDSYRDLDPMASVNLMASIANSHVEVILKSTHGMFQKTHEMF